MNWGQLSSSILNKFAPSHAIFKQQLQKMKNNQVDFLEQERIKENLEKKAMLRQQLKGYESPKTINELQAKMLQRKQHRKRLYSENEARMVKFHI